MIMAKMLYLCIALALVVVMAKAMPAGDEAKSTERELLLRVLEALSEKRGGHGVELRLNTYHNTSYVGDKKTNAEGRVEVLYDGVWSSICSSKTWDKVAATLVCRQIGLPYTNVEFGKESFDYKGAKGTEWIHCQGNETRLDECDKSGWGSGYCDKKGEAVTVNCKSDPSGNGTKKRADLGKGDGCNVAKSVCTSAGQKCEEAPGCADMCMYCYLYTAPKPSNAAGVGTCEFKEADCTSAGLKCEKSSTVDGCTGKCAYCYAYTAPKPSAP